MLTDLSSPFRFANIESSDPYVLFMPFIIAKLRRLRKSISQIGIEYRLGLIYVILFLARAKTCTVYSFLSEYIESVYISLQHIGKGVYM